MTDDIEQRLAAIERENAEIRGRLEATAEAAVTPSERARRQRIEENIQRQKELNAEAEKESEQAFAAAQRYRHEQIVAWAASRGDRSLISKWYAERHLTPPPGVVLE